MVSISKTLSSRTSLIPGCAAQLLDPLRALALQKEDMFKIRLCLEEALANAVVHGNRLVARSPVEVSLRIKNNAIEIDVVNQGKGFDFRKLHDPTIEKNREKLHGRGLFLIKSNMDRVVFFDEGRGITMTKFLTTKGAGRAS